MNRQTVHYLLPRQSFSEFCPIYQILPSYDRSAPGLPAVLRRRGRRKVVTLYKFGPFLGTPDSSPFVIKVMMLLKLAGVSYQEAQGNPLKAPQKFLPYIEDNGAKIADSSFIRFYLEKQFQVDFDAGLDAEQR